MAIDTSIMKDINLSGLITKNYFLSILIVIIKVVCVQAVWKLSGSLLEMQNLRSHLRPIKSAFEQDS